MFIYIHITEILLKVALNIISISTSI